MVEHNIMLIFNSAVIEVYNLEIYSYFIDNFFVIAYINSYTLHGVLILVLFVCFTQELLCRHNSRLYVCTGVGCQSTYLLDLLSTNIKYCNPTRSKIL